MSNQAGSENEVKAEQASAEQLQSIAREAAFIAAVLSDQSITDKSRGRELKASLEILIPQLEALGLMEAYERDGGGFGIL